MGTSLPRVDWLPVEEAYFFLVTSTMCIWGLQLAMNVLTLDCDFLVAVIRVVRWARKIETAAVLQWTPARLQLSVFTLLSAPVAFLRGISHRNQVFFLIIPYLVIGFPLGRVSVAVADWLQIRGMLLYSSYLGIAFLLVLAWSACPLATLLLTAGVAICHFGHADTKSWAKRIPYIDFFARGGMILLAVTFQPELVAWIITQLLGGSPVAAMSILSGLSKVHMVCLVLSILPHMMKCHEMQHSEILLEQVLLIAIFSLLPPLLSLTMYVNGVYLPRLLLHANQLTAVRSSLASLWKQKANTVGGTIVLLIVVVVSCEPFFRTSSVAGVDFVGDNAGKLVKAALISLSALSIPNMLLMTMLLSKATLPETVAKHEVSSKELELPAPAG
jgi:Brp/Blh family beta-carotene 15,15'-monooxygenase